MHECSGQGANPLTVCPGLGLAGDDKNSRDELLSLSPGVPKGHGSPKRLSDVHPQSGLTLSMTAARIRSHLPLSLVRAHTPWAMRQAICRALRSHNEHNQVSRTADCTQVNMDRQYRRVPLPSVHSFAGRTRHPFVKGQVICGVPGCSVVLASQLSIPT